MRTGGEHERKDEQPMFHQFSARLNINIKARTIAKQASEDQDLPKPVSMIPGGMIELLRRCSLGFS